MIILQRKNVTGYPVIRSSTSGYPLMTMCEFKACETTHSTYYRQDIEIDDVATPQLANLYNRDGVSWSKTWPGSYPAIGSVGSFHLSSDSTGSVEDSICHSHGDASHYSQSMYKVAFCNATFTLPSGIMNPPADARLLLTACGMGRFFLPYGGSYSLQTGTIGTNDHANDWFPN